MAEVTIEEVVRRIRQSYEESRRDLAGRYATAIHFASDRMEAWRTMQQFLREEKQLREEESENVHWIKFNAPKQEEDEE